MGFYPEHSDPVWRGVWDMLKRDHLKRVAQEWSAQSLGRQLGHNPVTIRKCLRGWPLRAYTGRQVLTIRVWLEYGLDAKRQAANYYEAAVIRRHGLTHNQYRKATRILNTVRQEVSRG